MALRDAWEAEAGAWVRRPGHDGYDKFHRDEFFEIVAKPGRLTVDVGCGEGRVARDLITRGHRVVGIDSSKTLVAAARDFTPSVDARVADASALPLQDASADLVVAFMTLHDVDDLDGATREIARVLEVGGRLWLATWKAKAVPRVPRTGAAASSTYVGAQYELTLQATCRLCGSPNDASLRRRRKCLHATAAEGPRRRYGQRSVRFGHLRARSQARSNAADDRLCHRRLDHRVTRRRVDR